jgi:methionine-rich copper-binding protein CopC/uncharacterized protein (DUF2132 family)
VQNQVRRYLLGQLEEADQERIELRLLTDPSFGEEFDTIVDELTDQYVNNELTGEEREHVEKHFLNTPERRRKLEFATELLSHAEAERGGRAERVTVERAPGLLELFLAFWRRRSFAHVALTAAAVIIVAGLAFYLLSFGDSSDYVAINLSPVNSNRAESTAPARVQLPGSGLTVNLSVPEDAKDAKGYRVKLLGENEAEHDLTIDEQKGQTVTVKIPAALLTRGSYVLHLFKVKADGTEEQVRGSYFFNVE